MNSSSLIVENYLDILVIESIILFFLELVFIAKIIYARGNKGCKHEKLYNTKVSLHQHFPLPRGRIFPECHSRNTQA